MTSKRQLRAELAAAEATVDALRIKLAAANEDRDLAEISLAEARGKLRSTTTVLADAVRRREAKLTEATTQLAERGEALRIALEQSAQVPALRADIDRLEASHAELRAVAHSDAERSTATMRRTYGIWVAMIRVGDRMAAKADTQTAKEWEAAKEGRSLRGPDGRWLKTDTDKEHP